MFRSILHVRHHRCLVGCWVAAVLLCTLPAPVARAQSFESKGSLEGRVFLYPQAASNDQTNVVGEALLRYEPSLKATDWLRVRSSFDARIDTHDQVERRWFLDWQDRTIQRPPLSVRRLSALLSRGGLNVELGKQFIRWGKADVLNPTDRFAPRDFLSVVDNDFLAVTGARLTYESGGNTLDLVWVPHFTPSRIPLFNQRWSVAPSGVSVPAIGVLSVFDGGALYPRGSQEGVRFNRSGSGYEFSVSFYNGFNHLPLLAGAVLPSPLGLYGLQLTRVFPQMRMYGADAAIPNRWFTVKGEFGYFTSTNPAADEYGIYVVQLERQAGEWVFVGGYAGDFVTRLGGPMVEATGSHAVGSPGFALGADTGSGFAAERGLARAFLGRATFQIDTNRSVAFQAAVRQNGHGTWLKGECSQARGQHLRATLEANLIRGRQDDFIGEFRSNSNLNLTVRYSF